MTEGTSALLRAHRISERAANAGFDWPDVSGVRAKIDEELEELDQAMASGDVERITEELGDLLFTMVNLGRHLPIGAEEALRRATDKFDQRYRALEASFAAEGRAVHETPMDELEARWQLVKGQTC